MLKNGSWSYSILILCIVIYQDVNWGPVMQSPYNESSWRGPLVMGGELSESEGGFRSRVMIRRGKSCKGVI